MTTHTQEEIDAAYNDCLSGRYAHLPANAVKPEILPSHPDEQHVRIPIKDGHDDAVYSRQKGELWKEAEPPFIVRGTSEFA